MNGYERSAGARSSADARRSSGEQVSASARLSAGKIGRAHGLDGSFYVAGARPRLLAVGTVVTIADKDTTIVRRAGTDKHPLLRVEGIEDRTAAR